jgi:hypothetical protein
MPTRRLTRAELHALIWSQPPETVAAELGVSQGKLAQMLKGMAVPHPWSGYWSSPAATTGRIPTLSRARPDTPEVFEFEFEPPQGSEPETSLPKAARPDRLKGETVAEPSAELAPTGVMESTPTPPEASPHIPRLTKPHRFIAARIADQKKRRLEYQQWGWNLGRQSLTPLERRIRFIEDRLFKAIERRGHKVSIEGGTIHQVHFVIRGQRITYAIRERYRIQQEPLSDSEKREPWNLESGRTEKRVRVMTGVLALRFGEWGWGRKPFEDKPGRPLEDQVDDIVSEAEVVSNAENANAERRRLEAIQAHETYKRQEALRRRDEENARRWRYLRRLSDQALQARRVRRFLRVLEGRLSLDPRDVGAVEFLAWAHRQVDELDPLAWSVSALMQEVQAASRRE